VAGHGPAQLDPNEPRRLGALAGRLTGSGVKLAVVGFVIMIALAIIGDDYAPKRVAFAYLANFAFFISIGLGALFFVLVHTLARTGTVSTYRRLGENIAGTIPYLSVFVIPILISVTAIYHWPKPGDDAILLAKVPWLNTPFFIARMIIYLAGFSLIAMHFVQRSRKQDEVGGVAITRGMQAVSAPAIILYAFFITGFAFDLIKSLDAHWFSTMFGVYYFAGAFMAFHAFLGLSAFRLQERGFLTRTINAEHYHDIGKMTFAMVVFWAYISFSQYMLIWYGNIPEETVWYIRHGAGLFEGQPNTFSGLLLILLIGHFVIPFFGMISRSVKRNPAKLAKWCVWLLVMHWLDLIWLIRPELRFGSPLYQTTLAVNWVDIVALLAGLLAFGGVFIAALGKVAGDRPLVAENDPRMPEALAFENF